MSILVSVKMVSVSVETSQLRSICGAEDKCTLQFACTLV